MLMSSEQLYAMFTIVQKDLLFTFGFFGIYKLLLLLNKPWAIKS